MVESGNTVYDSRNNCNAIIVSASNSLISGCKTTVIPDGVKSIGAFAFADCAGLTDITIPNSVTTIGEGAFYYCSGLTSITIPKSVTKFEENFDGWSQFSGCTSLTSIVVESDNMIYDSRNNCNAIIVTASDSLITGCKTTVIPNSVKTIGWAAFDGQTSLTSITIPENVTSIEDNAFDDVPNIVYTGTATGSPWGARSVNGYVEGYLVYEDATKTNLLACSSAATGAIEIPSSVTNIESYAFRGCAGLTSVTIPNSVTSIGYDAFYGCTGLAKVIIYSSTPPSTNGSLFDYGDNVTIYVPCDALEEYRNHSDWGEFAEIKCIGATEIETNDEVMVEATANSVALAWPQDAQAGSYTLVISKNGEVFCTLTFNGNGQLMGIAFAPSSNGTIPAQAAEATVSGYQFTVTGLDEASHYTYSLTVKDAAGNVLHTYTGAFATNGASDATGLNNTAIVSLYTENGRIVCAGEFTIYDLLGRDVTRMNGQLNGVYIVKVGDKAQKVIVR